METANAIAPAVSPTDIPLANDEMLILLTTFGVIVPQRQAKIPDKIKNTRAQGLRMLSVGLVIPHKLILEFLFHSLAPILLIILDFL